MTPAQRRWTFLIAGAGFVAFYLWGMTGLPGFGNYPGPYGTVINNIAVAQTHATGVVSAINFRYRGFDTVGEECRPRGHGCTPLIMSSWRATGRLCR